MQHIIPAVIIILLKISYMVIRCFEGDPSPLVFPVSVDNLLNPLLHRGNNPSYLTGVHKRLAD